VHCFKSSIDGATIQTHTVVLILDPLTISMCLCVHLTSDLSWQWYCLS